MITVCLLFGFFLVFVHWLVSSLTRRVNSNLHQWSKVIEKRVLARFELGFLNSELKLPASKPQNLLGFKGRLYWVNCVCWCFLRSWPTFALSDSFFDFFFLVDRFPSESLVSTVIHIIENQLRKRSTESWTRVFGFQVQCADHYTFEPTKILRMLTLGELPLLVALSSLFVMIAVCLLFGFFLVLFHWLVSFLSRYLKSNLQQWPKLIEKRL